MTESDSLRTIDPSLPSSSTEKLPPIDLSKLPLPCQRIPSHVSSLSECALWQIQALMTKEASNESSLSEEEQDALDDGFVLCDLQVIRNKLEIWHRLFPRIKPLFAVKCNPDVMVTAVLGTFYEDVVGFDCASLSEIRLALQQSNNNTKRIIYANPQRAEKDLDTALTLGVQALTFDGSEELHKVHRAVEKLSLSPPPEMVLRILVPDGASSVPLGEKFGAPPERIEPLAREAMALELPIVGVSFHCGSGCHDPQAYCNAIRLAKNAMEIIDEVQSSLGITCRLLDVGGGYPGLDGSEGEYGRFVGENHSPNDSCQDNVEETTAQIASVVTPLLDTLFPQEESNVQIISEPGRYFVEAAYAVCSRIYCVRVETNDNGEDVHRHYYIAQGVQGVFKDVMLCGEEFVPIPLMLDDDRRNKDEVVCSVHGPSSNDFDVVCKSISLPRLEMGDWLVFDRMGAYTLSIAARSGTLPIRHVLGGGST